MITLGRILVIWALAWLFLVISRNAIHLFQNRILASLGRQRDVSRVETLSGVFRHAASFLIVGVAVLLTLDEIGFSITPLLATAGVAGIAIGFGAQSLVRDFITGLFMLIEGQVREGDYIEAAGKTGFVEEVTLRHIRMRDEAGGVHFIPNGIITTVTNSSREYTYALIEFTVPRDTDIDAVITRMQSVAHGLRENSEVGDDITGDLIVDGIEKLEAATMMVRGRLRVAPSRHLLVRRLFLKHMRAALEALKHEEHEEKSDQAVA